MRSRLLLLAAFALPAGISTAAPDFTFGDSLFRQRQDATKARQALAVYGALHDAYPEDPAAAWRLAMASQFVGLRLTTDEAERRRHYETGRDAARAAAAQSPGCAPCHFWAGIDMALYGEAVGALKMLFTLGTIREHLETAARLDPKYAYAGAYRVLGLIEQKLPGVLGGSDERARAYFEKAVAQVPENPLNYLFLCRLLGDVLHDAKSARTVAERGLSLPVPPAEDVESHEAYHELAQWHRDHALRPLSLRGAGGDEANLGRLTANNDEI